MTTSVNSSAHCGFSGGIGPPYSARPRASDTLRRCPRSSKSSATGRWPSRRSAGRSPGRGWSTPATAVAGPRRAGSGRRWSGRSFTAARRRGKLMLLDTDGGPTAGPALRDDRAAWWSTGSRRSTGCATARASSTRSGCAPASTFDDGGQLLLHDPRRFGSLELAPDESRLGPDALTVTLARAARRPWRCRRGPRRGRPHRSRPGSWTRSAWPAWATCWPTRSCGGPDSTRAAGRRSTTTSCARCTRRCGPRCASSTVAAARTWVT